MTFINVANKNTYTLGLYQTSVYFNTIDLKQSSFCTTYYFKILVSERKYKNTLKNGET